MTLALTHLDPNAPALVDHMVPGRGEISLSGNWARQLLENELDVGIMRPYVASNGQAYVTRNTAAYDPKQQKVVLQPKAIPVRNDNATLRFLDWIQLDDAVIKAALPRLKAVSDLQSRGLNYNLPNGIAKSVLQYQQQSNIGGAEISMDGLRQSESDRPVFSLIQFPLPIIHKDFQFSLRQVLESRTGLSPLDTTTAQLAGRRVAEQVEQLLLGCTNTNFLGKTSFTWAANTIQGYMNYANRISYSLTLPTAAGWTPADTVADVLQMIKASQQHNHFGPWVLYHGLLWGPYMNDDYKPTYNSTTLRERVMGIEDIQDVVSLDYVPDYSLILVQMTQDVVRMVVGMPITTVQWESHGGLQLNFKVMCVMVPQIRTDFYSNTGLVHGA